MHTVHFCTENEVKHSYDCDSAESDRKNIETESRVFHLHGMQTARIH